MPSAPIFGDGPVSPRGQVRPALRPSSFLPHKAPDIPVELFVSELPTDFLSSAWTPVSRSTRGGVPFRVRRREPLSSLAAVNPFSALDSDVELDEASLFSYDWVGRALDDVSSSVAAAGLPEDDIAASVALLPSLDPSTPDFVPSPLVSPSSPLPECGGGGWHQHCWLLG